MHLDGFLTFGNGCFKVTLSHAGCRFAGTDVHGKNLVEVVLMPFALSFEAFLISYLAIIKCVVMGSKGMISACAWCVLLCRAGDNQDKKHDDTHHAAVLCL